MMTIIITIIITTNVIVTTNINFVFSTSFEQENCLSKSHEPGPSISKEKNNMNTVKNSSKSQEKVEELDKNDKNSSQMIIAINASNNLKKNIADDKRVSDAITEIRSVLSVKPKGLSGLRLMCLSLRGVILSVADLSTSKAR